nr:hypothetical protein Iba_chr09eCG14130 [Ipomoea batatas]
MSADDNQNNSTRDYDDQYDDEDISELAPPKKMGKVHKGEGTSSRPKRKSTSKPNTKGGNDVELDADDTPTEMTVREEEKTKSTGKSPMEMAEADPPMDVHAADQSKPATKELGNNQVNLVTTRPIKIVQVGPR